MPLHERPKSREETPKKGGKGRRSSPSHVHNMLFLFVHFKGSAGQNLDYSKFVVKAHIIFNLLKLRNFIFLLVPITAQSRGLDGKMTNCRTCAIENVATHNFNSLTHWA